MNPERIFAAFPAPSYRGNQEQALADVRDAFAAGNDVVLVRAPTGSGKSLLARAIMGCARTVEEADPAEPTGAYYTTPQVSQLDDVAEDGLLDDVNVIRGKRNYDCILPGEEDTPVDRAPCARVSGFDCRVRHRCPYFSARAIASNRALAGMTLAYFMRTAGSEAFGTRDVVVVDEAHGLAEWAEMYATIDLNPRTVPVWEDLRVPDVDGVERTVQFAENLAATCREERDRIQREEDISPEEAARRDRLSELASELEFFVDDYRDPQSATTWLVDQTDGGHLTVKPMDPERYLKHTVWDRGQKFALLSATILDREAFCRQVGLSPANVALVDVGHTFPLEHRPLYDVTQGKMTYEHREETLPAVARTLVRVMANHPEQKGIVHVHSYDIGSQLERRLDALGVGDRVRAHDREDRDAALESWKADDDPSVFLAVKMEEALDLAGDLARWQVLCKAPFLNTSDSRVERRLEEGQWAWYYRCALRTVIQACGRVVRSPEDRGATYVADSSVLDLFDRARTDMPPWFREQVDAMTAPDLPPPDAEAALAEVEGATVTERDPPDRDRSADGTDDPDPDADRDRRQTDGRHRGGGSGGTGGRSSPMADVWDVD
ncbi:MAG: helicase C-terminal domain-containing protein [Halobacteriaceae archaeon]